MADGVQLDPAYSDYYISTVGSASKRVFILKYIVLAFMGAIYIGIGTQGMIVAAARENYFMAGIVYSFGLAAVIYLGGDFFCSNPLLFSAVLAKKLPPYVVLRDWIVTWIANIAGAIAVAAVIFGSGVNGQQNNYDEGSSPFKGSGFAVCDFAKGYAWLHSGRGFIGGIIGGALMQIAIIWGNTAVSPVGKYVSVALPSILFVVNKWHCATMFMYVLFASTFLDCPKAYQKDMWENMVLSSCGNVISYLFLGFFYWALYLHGKDEQKAAQ
jgi:formate/nitrite transporter FocA (FNT family)